MVLGGVMSVKIVSTGSCVGDRVLDNFQLSEMVDTSDEWIKSRTGIEERRIADNITTEELAYRACSSAIEKSGIGVSDIDLLIVATISSDTKVPSSAYKVAGKLGMKNTVCFDINAACSGFVYAASVAKSMMEMMGYRYAMIAGAEKLSKYVNWEDRGTCVLFGDGSGCAILKRDEPYKYNNDSDKNEKSAKGRAETEICKENIYNETQDKDKFHKNNSEYTLFKEKESSEKCMTDEISMLKIEEALEIVDQEIGGYYDENRYLTVDSKESISDTEVSKYIEMNGRQVYKFATNEGERVLKLLMERNNISEDEIVTIVSHQANKRIIETLASKTGVDIEKWFINLDKYGNTSSASIPIALDEAVSNLDLNKNKGKYILSVAFGGGLSYGGILLKIV